MSITPDLLIQSNSTLVDIEGLNSLESVGWNFQIMNNSSILSHEGLNNLQSIGEHLIIQSNQNLFDLCGIQNVLTLDGVGYGPYIMSNGYNPTTDDIIAGNCSQ